VSPHEEVANEEPLAQLPVRVWLRSARSTSHREPAGGRSGPRHSGEALHSLPGEAAHTSRVDHQGRHLEWSSSWQVADELGNTGGMAAPRYLLVRLGECIPAETGAAPMHLSRLDTGPQWRDFLAYGDSGRDPRGCLALDELLACPCCLLIYRQPVALPCGHSLCRSCFARISSMLSHMRRCPLCRADFPQWDLRVNLALSAVCDSLRAFRALQAATRGSKDLELTDDGKAKVGTPSNDNSALPSLSEDPLPLLEPSDGAASDSIVGASTPASASSNDVNALGSPGVAPPRSHDTDFDVASETPMPLVQPNGNTKPLVSAINESAPLSLVCGPAASPSALSVDAVALSSGLNDDADAASPSGLETAWDPDLSETTPRVEVDTIPDPSEVDPPLLGIVTSPQTFSL